MKGDSEVDETIYNAVHGKSGSIYVLLAVNSTVPVLTWCG